MATPVTIEVRDRGHDFHTQIANHPEFWGRGTSPDEAVGDLIRYHLEKFNISLVFRGVSL